MQEAASSGLWPKSIGELMQWPNVIIDQLICAQPGSQRGSLLRCHSFLFTPDLHPFGRDERKCTASLADSSHGH